MVGLLLIILAISGCGEKTLWDREAEALPTQQSLAKQEGIPLTSADLRFVEPAPKDNAGPGILNAMHRLGSTANVRSISSFYDSGKVDQMRGVLSLDPSAIADIQAEASKPSIYFKRDYSKGLRMLMPEAMPVSYSARILAAKAVIMASDGNCEEAVADMLLSQRILSSILAEDDPVSLNVVAGSFGFWVDCLQMELTLANGNRSLVSSLMAHKEDLTLNVPDLKEALGRELVLLRSSITMIDDMSFNVEGSLSSGGFGTPSPDYLRPRGVPAQARDRAYDARLIECWRGLEKRMGTNRAQQIAACREQVFADAGSENEDPTTRLALLATNGIRTLGDRMAQLNARSQLVKTMLGVWQYKQTHGSFPADLRSVMGPTTDPLGSADFRYRRENGGFVLYSVGLNGLDDGGHTFGEDITIHYPYQPQLKE